MKAAMGDLYSLLAWRYVHKEREHGARTMGSINYL